MPKVNGSPFAVDWHDKQAVIAYAKRLGPGQTVYKHDLRPNYNVTHTSRDDIWDKPEITVIHQT